MNYMLKKLRVVAGLIALLFFIWLVMFGHKTVGYPGIGLMLAGLVGILVLLSIYNKKYK